MNQNDSFERHPNTVEFEVYGKFALFTDPLSAISGEKLSMLIPSHEALRGIMSSVYFKPTITWHIDEVRVMNQIKYEPMSVKTPRFHDTATSDLYIYSYLRDVRYQVRAHFTFNMHQTEMAGDRNPKKHLEIAKRSIARGGRRDVFLGTRECQAYVRPCVFGEGEGAYDNVPVMPFGMMYYGLTYPDQAYSKETEGMLTSHFYNPVMRNGIIAFPDASECPVHKPIKKMKIEIFPNIKAGKEEKMHEPVASGG
jgi:CRISPR-associated protein Cas5d